MASYRTARDYDDTDDVSDHEGTLRLKTGKGANGSGRKSVKEVWGSEVSPLPRPLPPLRYIC